MRIYRYEIGARLAGEVVGEDEDGAVRNLEGLQEEVRGLLGKLGIVVEGMERIRLRKEVKNEIVEA